MISVFVSSNPFFLSIRDFHPMAWYQIRSSALIVKSFQTVCIEREQFVFTFYAFYVCSFLKIHFENKVSFVVQTTIEIKARDVMQTLLRVN